MAENQDNTPEIWLPVRGFENWYEVSSFGRIIRVMPGRGAIAPKILGLRVNRKGYACVYLHKAILSGGSIKKHITTHSLVLEAFVGPKPGPLYMANHRDGNKLNNYVDNLEWVTNQENIDHSWRLGLRHYIGENNHMAKLTEEQVKEILALKGKVRQRELAEKYGVHFNQIKAIHRGKSWKHITQNPQFAKIVEKQQGRPPQKLTKEQVRYIKSAKDAMTSAELGAKFGVFPTTIRAIWQGRTWKHV